MAGFLEGVFNEGDVRLLALWDAERALRVLDESAVDVVLSDLRLPGIDGLELLRRALARERTRVAIRFIPNTKISSTRTVPYWT